VPVKGKGGVPSLPAIGTAGSAGILLTPVKGGEGNASLQEDRGAVVADPV